MSYSVLVALGCAASVSVPWFFRVSASSLGLALESLCFSFTQNRIRVKKQGWVISRKLSRQLLEYCAVFPCVRARRFAKLKTSDESMRMKRDGLEVALPAIKD